MATNQPLVLPDNSAFVFTAPEVPYTFKKDSRTFWGIATTIDNVTGFGTITANFDPAGTLDSGTVVFGGGIPSLGIANGSFLLHGTVLLVNTGFAGPHFWASCLFKIHFCHPSLAYTSNIGVWAAFFEIPGWKASDIGKLFVNEWGPHTAPLNSSIGQVKC